VFDEHERLVKFDKAEDLISQYMRVRMDYYIKRKAYQVIALENETRVLSNKARFITELINDTLDLRKKKTAEVSAILKSRGYDITQDDADYKYLVRLPMDSVTEENIAKIMKERDSKISELDQLKSMTEKQIWLNELSALRKEYIKMTTENVNSESVKPKQKGVVVKSKTTAKVNKAK
jgi:DNA topoisomerase-2